MTRLDREGSLRGGNVDLAARSARAKQEAEVAGVSIQAVLTSLTEFSYVDNEYRKAVHWLWGLRSRRVKVLEDGYNVGCTVSPFCKGWMTRNASSQSLERIFCNATETVKKVLLKYVDTTMSAL